MISKHKLLIVDDDRDHLDILKPLLERAGFEVHIVFNGARALELVGKIAPDLIILDVLMPGLDGRETLRLLREQGNQTPVILLSQVGEDWERAKSLHEGADDYLNKPFNMLELIARIEAVLRRTRGEQRPLKCFPYLVCDDIVLGIRAHQVFFGGKPAHLGPRPFGVLEFLMLHDNEAISRKRLLESVWGSYTYIDRVVDNTIVQIRGRLEDNGVTFEYITTVPGIGYRFNGQVTGKDGLE